MRNTKYHTNLSKGCGLIEETLSLLAICDENTTKDSLADYVHKNNYLAKSTDKRNTDIVKLVFYRRYMKNNPSVPLWLKKIRNKGLMLSQFKQLLMIYTLRENALAYTYITNVFNELRISGYERIPKGNIKTYMYDLIESNKLNWGEAIIKRNISYIKTLLRDFDLINRKGDLLPFEIADFTVIYLMHELHFEGLSDIAIWNHEDWQLFGLDKYQVRDKILELNLKGGYLAQCTADLMTISWKYKSMEDLINDKL